MTKISLEKLKAVSGGATKNDYNMLFVRQIGPNEWAIFLNHERAPMVRGIENLEEARSIARAIAYNWHQILEGNPLSLYF